MDRMMSCRKRYNTKALNAEGDFRIVIRFHIIAKYSLNQCHLNCMAIFSTSGMILLMNKTSEIRIPKQFFKLTFLKTCAVVDSTV